EMNVQRRRHGYLSEETRDTWKIRIWNARPIITLRMRRIITQHSHGLIVVPKADERNDRIDCAFGCGDQLRIRASRVAHTDFAIGPENTTIRRDLLDTSFTEAEVSNRLRARQRLLHGGFKIGNYLPLKAAFILARIHSGVCKNSLGGKIAIWRVVLMQGMN